MGKYYNIFINTYISEQKMFDSWFDDVTPTQFPKTDINFFNLANNSTALEPWNKTTYKFRPSTKEETERTIKRRNLSYDSYEKAIQGVKRKSSLGVKHKVTLSTLTFHLSADNTLIQDNKIKRKHMSSLPRTRRNTHHLQPQQKQHQPHITVPDAASNRGFTNSLRHTNLLRIKQEHQNKLKEIIAKKQIVSKPSSNLIRLNKFERSQNLEEKETGPINLSNIVLGEEPRCLNQEYIRRPRKVSFVGIRKILNQSAEKCN